MIERKRKRESKREKEADIETEIGRDNEGERNLEMRVEFAITNVLKQGLRTEG